VTTNPLEQLLWDLDESLQAEGWLPLYTFSWWLRGQGRGLSEDQIATLCQQAYDDVTRRFDLRLQWFEWPAHDLNAGVDAEPDTPLDFDIRSKGTIDGPFLALVPDVAQAISP
jgi:hypothetical protein